MRERRATEPSPQRRIAPPARTFRAGDQDRARHAAQATVLSPGGRGGSFRRSRGHRGAFVIVRPVSPRSGAMHASLSLAFALLLLVAVPSATAQPQTRPAPVSLAAFDRFELADARLADALRGPDGHERARRELQMTLHDR